MRRKSLLANSGIVLLTQMWSLILAFSTTPYIIKKLGTDAYGILSLIVVLVGYLSFLDLGFSWGLIKYVAEFNAKDDKDSIKKTVATTLFIFFYLGLFASLLLIFSAGWITENIFNIPDSFLLEATRAIRISAIGFFFTFFLSVYSSLFKGIQRFDLSSITQSVFSTFYVIGTVIILYHNKGLIQIVWLSLSLSCFALIVHIILANRLFPGIPLVPRFHKNYFKLLANFSLFSMLSRLGMLAIFYTDKFFVSYFLPISLLSYYIVPFNLAQKINFMGSNIASVAMPLASEKMSLNQMGDYKITYYRAAKILWLLTLAPTLILIVFSDKILQLWIGPEFASRGTWPLIFLASGYFLISVASLDAVSIEGAGKPRVTALFLIITGVMNLILSPFLTKFYGITGTALGIFFAFFCLSIMDILFFNLYILKTSVWFYICQICIPCLKVLLIVAPFLFLIRIVIANNLTILVSFCFLSIAFVLIIGCLALFNADEKMYIKKILSRFLKQVDVIIKTHLFRISPNQGR
jgi:O-antigen/teichoic acid export membrane protein